MNSQQEQYEAMLQASKKMKKRLLKILAILFGAVIFTVALLMVFYYAFPKDDGENLPEISFFAPYEGDIFESEEYLALDRKIYYFDGYVYRSVEEDTKDTFAGGVGILCDLIECMTRGDAKAYNALFTDKGTQTPFSQQMVYKTEISYVSRTVDGADQLYTYRLEYRIHRNDGTLRRDVGSDAMRPQWAVVRIGDGGTASIDSLSLTAP